MKHVILAVALAIAPVAALAQGYVGDPGAGFKLGIEQLNNSGQIGAVTLFRRGAGRTQMIVNIDGAPSGRREAVKLYRGADCTDVAKSPTMELSDLVGRSSTSVVKMDYDRLLSGNYNVIVFSNTTGGARSVSCGHLYRG